MAAGRSDCYSKALDLLARRPHFRRELEAKLRGRRFPQEEVEEALDRLGSHGYMDDLKAARDLVAGAFARKGYGPRRMRAELERRGAAADAVEEALAAEGGDEREQALAVARRWRPGRPPDAAALARHLERKGYTASVVWSVVEALQDGPVED